MSQKNKINIAAIQMRAELAEVDKNLIKTETLVRQAAEQGANWVVLPEFFTSACAFHPKMIDAVLPIHGEASNLLKSLAKQLNIYIGGSFLAAHEKDIFNTFVLVSPDGIIIQHNKDIPTMWENCYYIGGQDEGVLNTDSGSVGVALCWEMLRSNTAKRLLGKVDFIMSGSCWWNLPESAPNNFNSLRKKSLALLNAAPKTFAKMLGVPIVHAGHAGNFEGYAAPNENKKYVSHYLGESMIVDAQGNVLAHLTKDDGEDIITAEISIGGKCSPSEDIPDDYWIHDMPKAFLSEWEKLNKFGIAYYKNTTRKMINKH